MFKAPGISYSPCQVQLVPVVAQRTWRRYTRQQKPLAVFSNHRFIDLPLDCMSIHALACI
eukprot:2648927-Amphidinium_carterae.3